MLDPIIRPLALSKQLYQEGLRQAAVTNTINKMIALHHFHGAIEIVLRMIVLKYGIKPEKELNITFDQLVADIDKSQELKDQDKKLPYRQQIRVINTHRNLIQHHAQEITETTLNESAFFSRAFFITAFKNFFNMDFETFSPIELIKDTGIRGLVQVAKLRLEQGHYIESCAIQKYAFFHLLDGLEAALPKTSDRHYQLQDLKFDSATTRQLGRVFDEVEKGIADSFKYSTLLVIGVPFAEYLRFSKLYATLAFTGNGTPHITSSGDIEKDEAIWALSFVTDAILKLESVGAKSTIERDFIPKIVSGLEKEFSQGPQSVDISHWFE